MIDFDDLILSSKLGVKRIKFDLSGSIQRASAQLYSAWLVSGDRQERGNYSRQTLCTLWNTPVPTLLK